MATALISLYLNHAAQMSLLEVEVGSLAAFVQILPAYCVINYYAALH